MEFQKLTLEELLDASVKEITKKTNKFSSLRTEVSENYGTIKFTPKHPAFTDPERQWIGVRIKRLPEPSTAYMWLKQYSHVMCDRTMTPAYFYAKRLVRGWKYRDTSSAILSSVLQSFKIMHSALQESIVTFDFNYAFVRFMHAKDDHNFWMDEFVANLDKLNASEQSMIVHAAGLKGYSAEDTHAQFQQVRKNIRAAKLIV